MTKKKLNLEELKVTSFVTGDQLDEDKVKGGLSFNCGIPTINVVTCVPTPGYGCGTGDTAPAPGSQCF